MSNPNRIYSIAKSVQPFIRDENNIEQMYRTLLRDSNLSFIKELVQPNDIPVLIFTAYEISKGNDDRNIVEIIKNNIYVFTVINFSDVETEITCEECSGNGEVSCSECNGDGEIDCNECDGTGEQDCSECGGDGQMEDVDGVSASCDGCQGGGKVECDACDGSGYNGCGECYRGYNKCYDCEGNGSITCDDRIPFIIETYMSYDEELKNTIFDDIENDKGISSTDYNGDKTFLLSFHEVGADESETEYVNEKYENSTYFGTLLNKDDFKLSKFSNYTNSPLRIIGISSTLDNRFIE